MLAVPRQEELYAMNGGHGDMEGIDSSFGWYLKYVRNHLRQFFPLPNWHPESECFPDKTYVRQRLSGRLGNTHQ
jgi:hypothetical protein